MEALIILGVILVGVVGAVAVWVFWPEPQNFEIDDRDVHRVYPPPPPRRQETREPPRHRSVTPPPTTSPRFKKPSTSRPVTNTLSSTQYPHRTDTSYTDSYVPFGHNNDLSPSYDDPPARHHHHHHDSGPAHHHHDTGSSHHSSDCGSSYDSGGSSDSGGGGCDGGGGGGGD